MIKRTALVVSTVVVASLMLPRPEAQSQTHRVSAPPSFSHICATPEAADIRKRAAQIVLFCTAEGWNGTHEGSGFLLGTEYPHLGLSAYHLIRDISSHNPKVKVAGAGVTNKKACVLAFSQEKDLLLLGIDTASDLPAIGRKSYLGEQPRHLIYIACQSERRVIIEGEAMNCPEGFTSRLHLCSNAPTQHGFSGAPVFDLLDGALVGMHTGRCFEDGAAIGTSAQEIQEFLDKVTPLLPASSRSGKRPKPIDFDKL